MGERPFGQVEKICEAASITLNLGLVGCVPSVQASHQWSRASTPTALRQGIETRCTAMHQLWPREAAEDAAHQSVFCLATSRVSGVRVGAPAMTTRGCTEQDFKTIGVLAAFSSNRVKYGQVIKA